MARLPQPGSDNGTWGDILNEYLSQTLKSDGTIKDNAVTSNTIAPNAVTSAKIATDAVGATQIADGSITNALIADGTIAEAKLTSAVQTKLNASASPDWSAITNKPAVIAAGADQAAARTAIGAGTSNLGIGTSGTTAAAGNDSRLSDSRAPNGAASGDLSGTYPSPTVAKVNGVTVTGTPAAGNVLTASSATAASWGAPAAVASSLVIPDMLNSWWAIPCAVFDPIRNIVHVTGVSRGSALKIGTFDLGLKETREVILGSTAFSMDDHYTPALLWDPVDGTETHPPLVVWSVHDQTNNFRVRRGAAYDLGSLGTETALAPTNATSVSYATILRKPGTDTIVLTGRMTVSGVIGCYFMRSTDRGQNWTGPYRLHGKDYFTWRLSADGNTAYCVATPHPTASTNPEPIPYIFKINMVSGDMTAMINTSTVIGNIWTDTPAGTTAIITSAEMDQVVSSDATYSHRVLDVAPDGTAVLLAKFARADTTNGTFIVRRLSGGVWSTETIGATGLPFGYQQSFYIGGGMFDNNGSTAYLVQESGGIYSLDKWTASGGVWTKGQNIRTAPAGSKIGRPRIPMNAEGLGIITWGEYTRYSSSSYQDYYGHQRIADLR